MGKRKKNRRQVRPDRKKLKKAQKIFYHIMRKAKRKYWQNIFKGIKESSNKTNIWSKDKNRYLTTLKYINPKLFNTTLALIGPKMR